MTKEYMLGLVECISECYNFNFIQIYQAATNNQVPTANQVYNKFVSLYSKDDAEEVFGSDSEYDEWRKVCGQLNILKIDFTFAGKFCFCFVSVVIFKVSINPLYPSSKFLCFV